MRAPILSTVLSLALSSGALAQSTAFTYQGQLKDGGSPANGLHDFRFRLFSAAAGGAQLGATQCIDNLQVTGGLFTATIDFGAQFLSPSPRFIEIEVRRDTGLSCSNTTGFTVLTTRQAITPAPTATHAKSAFALDAADGSISNAVFVDNAGWVGIGTTTPGQPVHIANTTTPSVLLQDTGPDATQTGYLDFRNASGTETGWLGFAYGEGNPDFGIVANRPGGDIVMQALGSGGNLVLLPNNSVGIGTSSPAAKLDVRGSIRLGTSGEFFAPASQENLRIVRGTVDGDGTILNGLGFTVDHVGTGSYRINFSVPFAGGPSILAQTRTGNFFDGSRLGSIGLSSFTFEISLDGHGYGDGRFNFIAAGPR